MTETPRPTPPSTDEGTLRAALDAVEQPLIVLDADGGLQYWNRAVRAATGSDDERLDRLGLHALLSEDAVARLEEVSPTVAAGDDTAIQTTVVTNEGEHRPYELRLTALSDDGEGVCVVFHDRSGDSRTAGVPDEAARSEREAVLGRMTDAFFGLNTDWELTYVNAEAEPVLAAAMGEKVDREAMVGRQLWESIPEAVGTPFYDAYHEAMETQEPVTFEAVYEPIDKAFQVRAYPSSSALSVYFRDITEQRRQREVLTEREEVLQRLYDVTADTDRTLDEKLDELLEIGCSFLDLRYGSLSKVDGQNYTFEAVRAPDGTIEVGDTVALSATNCERAVTTEETLVLNDVAVDAPTLTEKAGYAEWGISCYLGGPVVVDGDIHGTFCFYDQHPRAQPFTEWDVTLVDLMSQWVSYELTRQRIHDRLERQNERLEEFASIASHDLRSPLGVLAGSLELAEETGDADHFERCWQAIGRMETLIDDLLTLARAGDDVAATESVSLLAAVQEAWATVETAEASLVIGGDRTLSADPGRLRQLLENLLRNSVDHGGESVTVTVAATDDGFYVADDGPGIPEADRTAVFDEGYTTAPDGTGFGLNIVRQVAHAHGWAVAVTESPDGGAQFEFSNVAGDDPT